MFCINCGKELKEGTVFCVYCGCRQGEEQREVHHYEEPVRTEVHQYKEPVRTEGNYQQPAAKIGFKNITMFDIGIIGFYALILLRWLVTFVMNFGYVLDVIKYDNSKISFIFLVLYIVLFLVVAAACAGSIWFTLKKKYHIMNGLIIGGIGLLLKILSLFVRFIPWDSILYVGGVVISIYGSIGLYALSMGLLCALFLYAKNVSSI